MCLCASRPLHEGADGLHFGDNKAANGAARKGFFGSTDLNLLAHKLKARSVVDRLMHEHGAIQVLFEWPNIFEGLSV